MKQWSMAFAILTLVPLLLTAQEAQRSRAEMADSLVGSVFAEPPGMRVGFDEQRGRMLGDSVAAAVARKVRLADLLDSETAERVLTLLHYAFVDPTFIHTEEDRKPGVTLLLLDHLANYSPDPAVRQRAETLLTKLAPK